MPWSATGSDTSGPSPRPPWAWAEAGYKWPSWDPITHRPPMSNGTGSSIRSARRWSKRWRRFANPPMSPPALSPTTASLTDPSLRDPLALGLERPLDPQTARSAEILAHAFGPSALALIHYGSHIRPADARPESAYDFFVIVERYTDAYRSLHTRAGTGYSPGFASWLNRLL